MNKDITNKNLQLVSILLRLSIGTLFLGAAIIKVKGGIDGSIAYYTSIFEKTIFPLFLVKMHASIIMPLEFILAIWLFSGFKLKTAWIASAVTLVTLAFGMIFAYKFDVTSDNYLYVLICCLGILLSPYDKFIIQGK